MREESKEKEQTNGLFIDFSAKFALVKSQETRRNFIYEVLCKIAKNTVEQNIEEGNEKVKRGLLVAYGKFDRHENRVYGLLQLPYNKNNSDNIMWIQDKKFEDFLIEKAEKSDGAIIINHDGLVLGSEVYICVTNLHVSLEEECATRHLTAMSFSERDDVIATYTLSEETSKVRMYVDGKRAELYDPKSIIISNNVM